MTYVKPLPRGQGPGQVYISILGQALHLCGLWLPDMGHGVTVWGPGGGG